MWPFKRINMVNEELFLLSSIIIRVLKHCLAVSRGPGGFRELREACMNHFHLSWYLSDSRVPSYAKTYPGGGRFRPH